MGLLNILFNSDGTTAWDTLFALLVCLVAGWLLHRYMANKKADTQHRKAIKDWEAKLKRVESEYRNYRSNIASNDKHQERSLAEMNGRVKALEGDIRKLADEKNLAARLSSEKDLEIKKLQKLLVEKDDVIRDQKDLHQKEGLEWSEKLGKLSRDLSGAVKWEDQAKKAEADIARYKEAAADAQRQKLEAELRLKSVSEFAGKAGSLELELAKKDQLIAGLQAQLSSVHVPLEGNA